MTLVSRLPHWITATFGVALLAMSVSPPIAMAQRPEPTAPRLMQQAHDGRAVWLAFPGFTAEIAAASGSQSAKGTLRVAADGTIELNLEPAAGSEWVERTLSSVVSHRLPGGAAESNVEFADNEAAHPLGRLIRSKEPAEKSLWRVKGDVLTEVHRISDKSRMIISVGEVTRTPAGTHLPRSYSVTTFDAQSGAIQQNRQIVNEWTAVDGYDVPTRLVAIVSKSDGSRHVEEITLTNHKVNPGQLSITELAPLEANVTSFGAAVAGGHLYVYGGHRGTPHRYSAEEQSGELWRLNLAQPTAWERVAEGPRRTGLAMVAHDGQLYRVGGWEAKNAVGDKWDLHSQADLARFDVKTGQWQALPPLPAGRSSHDAALIGSKLYVVGGWNLSGQGDGEWHATAHVCDLAANAPAWHEIAPPPFNRRALAVAGWQGKLYVIGGMDDSNDVTTGTAVYDPASNAWTGGPKLPGSPYDGFGATAIGCERGLFATTGPGLLCRLQDDGKSWETVGKLNHPRRFHRLVADDEGRLLVVGGTSRMGKVKEVELLEVKR
jgi:N-acetylneuraminic acid mutarotase